MERVQRKFGLLQVLLIAAALTTALIHLYLGLKFKDVIFVLNAVGFAGLTGVYLLPLKLLQPFRGLARWALAGEAVLTIIMWAIINGKLDALGFVAIAAEVLIVVFCILDRKSR